MKVVCAIEAQMTCTRPGRMLLLAAGKSMLEHLPPPTATTLDRTNRSGYDNESD
jgi:hypothetical protein